VIEQTHPTGDGVPETDCGQQAAQQAIRVADDCTLVIVGATGDLAGRKLLPALANLASRRALPETFRIIGVGRHAMTDEAYREIVRRGLDEFSPTPVDVDLWRWLEARTFYVRREGSDASAHESFARRLADVGSADEAPRGYLYYLATPPDAMPAIVGQLGAAGLLREASPTAWRRVILEKPFGHDLASARALNHQLARDLAEPQIYRIDHYLGKETVQNLMALRFANGIFEPVWNRRYIDQVQITVAETVGVEQRGGYYDGAGALRDMVQNHMFQLLALTAMEPPNSFDANAVRDERIKVLQAIRVCSADEVMRSTIRGQYVGAEIDGRAVPGYRDEPNVPATSTTETYLAMKFLVENWRWADVPFYLRTGKRLPKRVTEIAVRFRNAPLRLFRDTPVECLTPNQLVVRIQPDEGIALQFQAKVPGPHVRLGTVNMDFSYADYFAVSPTTGYETLLYDCMIGDQTLFHRADMVEAGWSVIAPVLDLVTDNPSALLSDYPAHSWGPKAADDLLARDGRSWRRL
jgi:glucose-6-phosphate 1-dehydrogenase